MSLALRLARQQPAYRDPRARAKDFDEIDSGFTFEQARVEAERCVQCSKPACAIEGCPLGNAIPRWIDHVVQGRLRQAAWVLATTAPMPELCGKLCPHERLCESRCVLGQASKPVAIGALEAFVGRVAEERGWFAPAPSRMPSGLPVRFAGAADRTDQSDPTDRSDRRGHPERIRGASGHVAIIGSGPAGLAAADRLLALGHAVTMFERAPVAGGVPSYGIPSFKYAKSRVERLVERVRRKGAAIFCGIEVGRDVTVRELRKDFDAVLLAIGAPRGRLLDLPGCGLEGIYSATGFLVNGNVPAECIDEADRREIRRGRRCVVIGGGDTSADCVRTAVRLGFEEVRCLYRRSLEEITGRLADRGYAQEEGVVYQFLTSPTRFEGSGRVERVVCERMALGEPDGSGRARPVPIPGSEYVLEADAVVLSLGYDVDRKLLESARCQLGPDGLVVDDNLMTSRRGVFAAGDVVRGADLIVHAARDGRDAAMAIDRFLREG